MKIRDFVELSSLLVLTDEQLSSGEVLLGPPADGYEELTEEEERYVVGGVQIGGEFGPLALGSAGAGGPLALVALGSDLSIHRDAKIGCVHLRDPVDAIEICL